LRQQEIHDVCKFNFAAVETAALLSQVIYPFHIIISGYDDFYVAFIFAFRYFRFNDLHR